MSSKPEIIKSRKVAQSELFEIQQVDLRFSNGEYRCFERISGRRGGAVMVVPVLDNNTLVLVREYTVGTDRYELGFPKGLLEPGEPVLEAANRELMEETGYGARQITPLKTMNTAPGYMIGDMQLVLAQDLYEKKLPGDEPEEIEVVHWKIDDFPSLLEREDFSEARSIAAFFIARDLLTA